MINAKDQCNFMDDNRVTRGQVGYKDMFTDDQQHGRLTSERREQIRNICLNCPLPDCTYKVRDDMAALIERR